MSGGDDPIMKNERIITGRFHPEDVGCITGQFLGVQSFKQCLIFHQRGSGCIDDHSTVFHFGNGGGIEYWLISGWTVEGNDVAFAKQLIQGNERKIGSRIKRFVWIRVVGDNLHAHRQCHTGHHLAYQTAADNTEYPVFKLETLAPGPLALLQLVVNRGD